MEKTIVTTGKTIDEAIENGTDKDEYDRFCDEQVNELLSGQI